MPSKIPSPLGLALTNLLKKKGWTAKELATAANISASTISAYEAGEGLTREKLEELASYMGVDPEEVDVAVTAAYLVLPAVPPARTPVDPTSEQLRVIDKAVSLGGSEQMHLLREELVREVWADNAKQALEEGRQLANELLKYSDSERRVLVADGLDYQHWGLAVVLCAEAEKAASDKPQNALKLGELAVFVAEHVAETDAFRSSLAGWCLGFLGNAQKAANDLPKAEATFSRSCRLWEAGEDTANLLSEARLLDLEASLRWAQRQFDEALRLHERALAVAQPDEMGFILLNKSATLEQKGDYAASIEVLELAAQHIDGDREPRLLWVLRFNQAANLVRLSRASEAVPLLAEVQLLAERLRNEADWVRTRWLRSNCSAGLGRLEEALAGLEEVRRDFVALTLPYDFALSTLDLALLYRKMGRSAEIKILAGEMLKIFQAQRVQQEAIAAVVLFREAAEKEQVTEKLVRRLQDYLSQVKHNPNLPFEA